MRTRKQSVFCRRTRGSSKSQAMKALRQELSADGRLDILERVMSYRGGYSQEVCTGGVRDCNLNGFSTTINYTGSTANRTGSLFWEFTRDSCYQRPGTGRRHRRSRRGHNARVPHGRPRELRTSFARRIRMSILNEVHSGNKRAERVAGRGMPSPFLSRTHCPWISTTSTTPRSSSIVRQATSWSILTAK